jgi:beta-lactamase class A
MKKSFFLIALAAFVVLAAYSGRRYYQFSRKKAEERRLMHEARKASWQELQRRLNKDIRRFRGQSGIVLMDLETGWEFSHNKDKLFPSASLAKVPIMASCFLAAQQDRIRLDGKIALKSSEKLAGSGTLKNMPEGTELSVEELIGRMIYDSDNTATNMLTSLLGMDHLQDMFGSLGLKNTNLSRRIADYKMRDKGVENYTTAEDMALLLDRIYRNDLGGRSVSKKCMSILKLTHLNDRIPRHLPKEITIAHKTGLERGICHDAGIVFTPKGDFLIVVLTKHPYSTSASSKEFIAKISLHAYEYLM